MVIKGKKMDYLGAALGENYFSDIKKNYSSLDLAGKIISLFGSLSKEDDGSEADFFSLLNDHLQFIDSKKGVIFSAEIIYYSFLLKMLVLLGYKPELEKCLKCGLDIKKAPYLFDHRSGGLICSGCVKGNNNNIRLSEKSLGLAKLSMIKDINFLSNIKIDNKYLKEYIKIVEAFYRFNFSY
jgi:DNA repair protein RecO (recombination protein O)